MDQSIRTITPADHFERGRRAHANGRGIDDHHHNPGAPAIADYQRGWRQAEYDARNSRVRGNRADQYPQTEAA